MKKPKSVEPPKLATWLLERFSPESGPLAGDLIEAFKHGRSSSWYWRQVLAAILIAVPGLVRKNLVLFAYTVGCGAAISVAWFFMFPNAIHDSAFPRLFAVYAKSYEIEWPWSFVYQMAFLTAFQAGAVMVALTAHFAFSHHLRGRSLLRALLVVLVVLTISNVALPLASGLLSGFQWFGWVLVSAPAAIAFLFGNWRAGDPARR
jgi:hypothetical protein